MENKEIGIIRTKMPVKQIGGSFYLLVDKKIRELLHIENGMILGAKLWNIEIKIVTCPKCEHVFSDEREADPHDCPVCGEEFKDIDSKEKIAENTFNNPVVNNMTKAEEVLQND